MYKEILPSGELFGETAIRMYTFRNSGQVNELDYIDLPAQVFKFLEEAFTGELRRALDELLQESRSEVYSRLLSGESIQLFFVNRKERRVVGGWQLFELYLKEVEEMDPKRMEAIKRVGERLYQYLKKTSFKTLDDLEMAENYQTFFVELNKIQKDSLVWEMDDLAYLFPETKEGRILWRETRNILLGYIYELKHKDGEVKKS
jgi:CRISPR-associated protein Cas8b1/Cst1 subtype I-B